MGFRIEERTLDLGSMSVHHIAFGTGKKPLVLIQGLNTRGIRGAGLSLAWMYRMFAKTHRVYLFDRRPHLPEDITVRELAADIALAMDRLDIRQAHVLGVSQGGMIAQYLAIDRPDLVEKLVLAVTLARNNDTLCAVIGQWILWTEQGAYRQLVTDMAERMYSEPYLRRYRPFLPLLTLLQKPKDPRRFIRLARACLTCAAYEELERIRCPVLVIGGGQDKIVTGEASMELAHRLNCPLYLYQQLGHGAYEEAKDFNSRVYAFFMA